MALGQGVIHINCEELGEVTYTHDTRCWLHTE